MLASGTSPPLGPSIQAKESPVTPEPGSDLSTRTSAPARADSYATAAPTIPAPTTTTFDRASCPNSGSPRDPVVVKSPSSARQPAHRDEGCGVCGELPAAPVTGSPWQARPCRETSRSREAFIEQQLARRTSDEGVSWAISVDDVAVGLVTGLVILMVWHETGMAGIGLLFVPSARRRGLACRAIGLLRDTAGATSREAVVRAGPSNC